MESLQTLLVQNQSYLGKLRARLIYCVHSVSAVEHDHHKQFGPFSGYWDEWLVQAEEMRIELCDNIIATDTFLIELLDFIITIQEKKRLTKSDKSYVLEVTSLAEGKLAEQKELLKAINEGILIHKQLTEKLLLVEAIDGLTEE
jgi:hypothetical protein